MLTRRTVLSGWINGVVKGRGYFFLFNFITIPGYGLFFIVFLGALLRFTYEFTQHQQQVIFLSFICLSHVE